MALGFEGDEFGSLKLNLFSCRMRAIRRAPVMA
jgi:hypothetical protein